MDRFSMTIYVFCWILYFGWTYGKALDHKLYNHLAPEELPVRQGLRYIGEHPEIVQQFLTTNHTSDEIFDDPEEQLICLGCLAAVQALTTLSQYPYFVVDQVAKEFCSAVLPSIGWPPERVCPTVIDNFGRSVYDIMRGNMYGIRGACEFFTYCAPLDRSLETDAQKPLHQPLEDSLKFVERKGHARNTREAKAKNVLKVAQITDVHLDPYYLQGSPVYCDLPVCCHGDSPGQGGSAGLYGEYKCNVPPRTVEMFAKMVADLEPDVLFNTGDNPSHHLWMETPEVQMGSTEWVAEILIEANPNIPVFSVLGNHENFPSNLYYVNRDETKTLHDVFGRAYGKASMWGPEQYETFNRGGYYTVEVQKGLRLLAYNSNFGYGDNWYNLLAYNEPEPAEMVEWIKTTLQNARDNGEKVLMITHHPIGHNIIEYDRNLTQIVNEFGDIIKLHVVGHEHTEEIRLFTNEDGNAKSVQLLSQSSNTMSYVNPGVRLYYLDGDTMEPLDYEQYFLDITDGGSATIKMSYRASDEYGLSDLSPTSIQDFVYRLGSDDDLFNTYFLNKYTKAQPDSSCDEDCKLQELCRMVSTTLEAYRHCVRSGLMLP